MGLLAPLFLAAAILAAPPPSAGKPVPRIAQAEQASEETALAYARLYMPTDLVIDGAAAMFSRTFATNFNGTPEARAVARAYPGLAAEAEAAGIAAMRAALARDLPVVHARLAAMVRPRVSEAHLRAANRFLATDTARAAQRRAAYMIDPATAARPQRAADVEALITATVAELDPGEQRAFADFGMSAAGRAMAPLAPMLAEFTARETNGLTQGAAPDVQAAVEAVIERRMGKRQ